MKTRYLTRYLICYITLSLCFFTSCKTTNPVAALEEPPECEKSYSFIKNEVFENADGWLEFRDMEKIYKEYDIGNLKFPFACLEGKDKDFLRSLFGEPHREAIDKRNKIHTLVYCFSKECIEERSFGGMGGVGLIFFFDEAERVKDFYVQMNLVGHYQTLDRNRK